MHWGTLLNHSSWCQYHSRTVYSDTNYCVLQFSIPNPHLIYPRLRAVTVHGLGGPQKHHLQNIRLTSTWRFSILKVRRNIRCSCWGCYWNNSTPETLVAKLWRQFGTHVPANTSKGFRSGKGRQKPTWPTSVRRSIVSSTWQLDGDYDSDHQKLAIKLQQRKCFTFNKIICKVHILYTFYCW